MWQVTFKAHKDSARTRVVETNDRATAEFVAAALRATYWIVVQVSRI